MGKIRGVQVEETAGHLDEVSKVQESPSYRDRPERGKASRSGRVGGEIWWPSD